jgi:hypothetical protein
VIVFVSTGFRSSNKEACLRSVREQTAPHEHLYIEASEQTPPKPAMQNLWETVMGLPPDAIVAHLDGDDELARPDALAIVAAAYEDPDVWMTYGSQRVIDVNHSQADHRTKLLDDVPERQQDCPSHLKTYRAWLFQKAHEDPRAELLRVTRWPEGGSPVWAWRNYYRLWAWRNYYRCGAELYPMLEMCGPAHRRYIPEVLVNYRYDLCENKRMTPAEWEQEQLEMREVRALPARERL